MSQIENITTQIDIFIEWLDNMEKKAGLNDSQLAQRAGLSHTVLVRARQGTLPKWEASNAIANALDIPSQEVFIIAGLMEPPPNYDPEVARIVHKIATLPKSERAMLEAMLDGLMKSRAGKEPALVT